MNLEGQTLYYPGGQLMAKHGTSDYLKGIRGKTTIYFTNGNIWVKYYFDKPMRLDDTHKVYYTNDSLRSDSIYEKGICKYQVNYDIHGNKKSSTTIYDSEKWSL